MRALVFANGRVTEGGMLRRALEGAQAATIVCADGGALHARRLGLKPRIIIGDLDSLTSEQVDAFAREGVEIRRYDADKDETDLELALGHCVAIGARCIAIIGGLGGRIDQTLANIWLLALPMLAGVEIELVDGVQRLRLLQAGAHTVKGDIGDTISLIPLAGGVAGISTTGLRYALRGEPLAFGPARGISNVMIDTRATITLEKGMLLLTHSIGRA